MCSPTPRLDRLWPLLVFVAVTAGQTWTSCNPTLTMCPPDAGLSSSTYTVDFTDGADSSHWTSVGTGAVSYSPLGAAFTISKRGESPTLQTAWYFFFGRTEVHLRTAPGTGIVSCVVLESDDLDEVDWEWIGGAPDQAQTNYFGKGNTTAWDRGGNTKVTDTQGITHNYTIDWTPASLTWYVDGAAVRTLLYTDAVGGKNYPQTPMRLGLGIWAGGDPANANGTIAWAGGVTDYTKAPFTMYVERVAITNAFPAQSYSYSDLTGDWNSIAVNRDGDDGLSYTSPAENEVAAARGSGGFAAYREISMPSGGSRGQSSSTISIASSPQNLLPSSSGGSAAIGGVHVWGGLVVVPVFTVLVTSSCT